MRVFIEMENRHFWVRTPKVADLTDIRQLVKENNYGFSPWSSQAA
jgi:hypothetical protein